MIGRQPKRTYQQVIESLAIEALDFCRTTLPGLAQESTPPVPDKLESAAAINFLFSHAITSFRDGPHVEIATLHLVHTMVAMLSDDYGANELAVVAVPLLERRHNEYTALLDASFDAEQLARTLGRAMIRNIFGREVPEPPIAAGGILLFKMFTVDLGNQLRDFERTNRIDWL